jgi:predicted ATP-grasp superfamily ATP-dependent carboligase
MASRRSSSSELPAAVILAPAMYTQGLAAMRSLGPLGVRVYAPEQTGSSLWAASRFCAGLVDVGEGGEPQLEDPLTTLRLLERVAHKVGEGGVLIAASDAWAVFVADHAAQLSRWFRVNSAASELVSRLVSKVGLDKLAREQDTPAPLTSLAPSAASAMEFAAAIGYPVILKPDRSRPPQTHLIAGTPDELARHFSSLAHVGVVVCQEFIPGDDGDSWMFNGYFDEASRCLAGFVGRKVRQEPEGCGVATVAELAPSAEVTRVALQFLVGIGYRGVVDADLRFDARDGKFKVVDVNPRLGGCFRLFVDTGGLDVARVMYNHLIGRHVAASGQRANRRWLNEHAYFIDRFHRHGRFNLSVADVVRDLATVRENAIWSWTDPKPGVHMGVSLLRSQMRKWRVNAVQAPIREPEPLEA